MWKYLYLFLTVKIKYCQARFDNVSGDWYDYYVKKKWKQFGELMNETFETQFRIEEHFEHCGNTDFSDYDFYTWLAKHDAEKAETERQRIIGLLETRLNDCYEKDDMGGFSFMPELFIALIKGENE